MQVILSSSVTHYKHAALAAQSAGCLKRFITGTAFTKPWQHRYIERLPASWQHRIDNRVYRDLNPKLIVSIWLAEVVAKSLIRPLTGSQEAVTRLENKIYDRLSCSFVDPCDIFHFIATQGLQAARKALSLGAIAVMDERGAHPRARKKVAQLAYEHFGPVVETLAFHIDRREAEYNLADYIIVPSDYVANTLISEGIAASKVIVVPYGVDLSSFRSVPKTDHVFRVIFVGSLTPLKGVHLLIEAFEGLRLPNAELVLIGELDPAMAPFVEAHQDCLEYLGRVPHRELYKYYSQGSVLVFPSWSDAFGLVVLEAMACGLPAIVTTNCGAVVEDGVQGFVVPAGDSGSLKDRIQFLYDNEPLRQEMGEAAKSHAQQFSWDQYGERLIEAYRTVLTRKHGRVD